jgi:UDP-3-O-[3-hydroxymyristoyl] glucosamine N-acyltransferase
MSGATNVVSEAAHAEIRPGVTSGRVASWLGGELVGRGDVVINTLDALDLGGVDALGFIRSGNFARAWESSRCGAALVTRGVEVPGHDPTARALILVDNADMAMLSVLEAFAKAMPQPFDAAGVHPSAVVDPTAELGLHVSVGPHATIGPGARIGRGAIIGPGCRLGRDVVIGEGTRLHANVVIEDRCRVGRGSILHSGVVLGADGFGYRPAPGGAGLVKIPHIGHVAVGDQVEIGANSCVDRGKFGATIIGDGTKLDNQVQIGHNCRIGRCCVICGQVGIAGSVVIGDGVQIGGQAGIADNVNIGAGSKIAAGSGVMENLPPGSEVLGTPAAGKREQVQVWAVTRRLPEMLRTLKRLDPKLAETLRRLDRKVDP